MPHRRVVFLVYGLLVGLLLLAPARARPCHADTTDWTLVLDAMRHQEAIIKARLEAYKARQAQEAAARALSLERLTQDRARLALWQATATDPWEIRDVIAGLASLRLEAERLAQRPQQAWASLEESRASLELFKDRLTEIGQQILPDDFRSQILPYRESIKNLGETIASLTASIATETEPLRALSERIKEAEQSMQASLTPAWEAYYIERLPTAFTPHFLEILKDDIEDWHLWGSLCLELLQTRQNKDLLRSGALAGTLGMVLVAVVLYPILSVLRRRGVSQARLTTLAKAGACIAVGLFFFILAQRALFFLYSPLSSIGEILLTAALVHISRLGKPDTTTPSGQPPVLWPTWRLFALGLLIEATRVPGTIMGPLMTLALTVSAIAFHKRFKHVAAAQTLDRAMLGGLRFLLPLLAVMCLFGLPQTAILGASMLFYLALALRMAAATTHFLGQREMHRHHGNPSPFLGILAGAGFPFFLLLYLVILLWLLSTQFGGENVFHKVISTEAHIESVGISLKKLAALLAGFYVTKAVISLTANFINDIAGRRRSVERGAKTSLLTLNSYVWWGSFVLFAMTEIGLSLTSVAVVAGGLSVGIGFGLQTLVNNFISGLILLFGRSISAGDTIQLPEGLGVVQEVNIRNTEVLTKENATIFVPNSELVSGRITNWTHGNTTVRRDVAIGVAYGSDTAAVRRLLLEAAASCPAVLANPAPTVLHWDFGPSTLDFRLRVWLEDVDGAITAMCGIRETIDGLFRKAGIEIAFPQADLHLRSAPALEQLVAPHIENTRRQLSDHADRLTALEAHTRGRQTPPAGKRKDVPHDA